MQYGYGGASDERIKTNIKTIENALDKTLLLRGVEYNDIRIEPERKKIGLIAQEVELIMMSRATVCLKGELKESISGYHSKHDGHRIFRTNRGFFRRTFVTLLRMERDSLRPIVSLL
jgi:hypothetical protein